MLTRETNLIQYLCIHENLLGWLTMAAHSQEWKNVKGISAYWKSEGSSQRHGAHVVSQVGLCQKVEKSAMED